MDNLPAELRKSCEDSVFGESPHLEDGAEATRHALRKSLWNKSKVARLLGISRRSIYRKIDKFGIVPEL